MMCSGIESPAWYVAACRGTTAAALPTLMGSQDLRESSQLSPPGEYGEEICFLSNLTRVEV